MDSREIGKNMRNRNVSWSGNSSFNSVSEILKCKCGDEAPQRVSKTTKNPSRKFYGCAHFGEVICLPK